VVNGPAFDPDRARLENPSFFHAAEVGRPWVVIKLATSLDGRIAEARGQATRITGAAADEWVQDLRSGFDAIMVGGRTAAVDDPRLTVRRAVAPIRAPLRIVLDSRAGVSPRARLFTEGGGAVHLLVSEEAPRAWRDGVEAVGATLHAVPSAPSGGLDLNAALSVLAGLDVHSLLCEGGGVTATRLLQDDLAQRLQLLVAPTVLGPEGVPAFSDPVPHLDGAGWRRLGEPRSLGDDTLLSLRRTY